MRIFLTLIFIFSFLNADITQYFPKLDGRVVDEPHLLSTSTKDNLTAILKNHEEQTSNQIVVVVLNSLHGYEIADYTYQLGRYWQIGQKDRNNGVILLISMEEKKIRIEVGYGLEGALTDKIAYEIINYTIKPKFRANQFEQGVISAVNEIIQAIKGEYKAKIKDENFDSKLTEMIAIGYFIIIFISMFTNGISRKLKNQLFYKATKSSILSSFFGFFTFVLAQGFTSYYIILSIIVFLIVFIFNFKTTRNVDFDKLPKNDYHNSSRSSGGFGGFSNSSSGSFGGGFSGGGGSFGGGGASGGW